MAVRGQSSQSQSTGEPQWPGGPVFLEPVKRQRIPRTMPLRIEDADWGTSLSRLRYQLQDYSPLYPDGLSSESSDSGDDEEGSSSSETLELTTACPSPCDEEGSSSSETLELTTACPSPCHGPT